MADTPATVMRNAYGLMSARDLDGIGRLYDPRLTLNGEASSPEDVAAYCNVYLTAFGDLTLTVERLVAEGEWVAARVVSRGTHTAPLNDLPATGRRVEIAQHDLARVVDGRIVECWTMFDRHGMLRQLGALPG